MLDEERSWGPAGQLYASLALSRVCTRASVDSSYQPLRRKVLQVALRFFRPGPQQRGDVPDVRDVQDELVEVAHAD